MAKKRKQDPQSWDEMIERVNYLDRCIDGAAKHAGKNEAEISRLQDRVKNLEAVVNGLLDVLRTERIARGNGAP